MEIDAWTTEDIREFHEESVRYMHWLEETVLAVKWLYLPEERLEVTPLYGYHLPGLKEKCENPAVFPCGMEIHNPAFVYHGSLSHGDSKPGIFKLDWNWSDPKADRLNLNTVVGHVPDSFAYDNWYLATDTFIPDISSDHLYIINKPSTAFSSPGSISGPGLLFE